MVLGKEEEAEQTMMISVHVVYYLCRGVHLEHPHLIDVPFPAGGIGLYLRDVKRRLTAVRGKAMVESFSWSCKRQYKTAFIWQDLSDEDEILPLADGEYVLKGSELFVDYYDKSDYADSVSKCVTTVQVPTKARKITSKKLEKQRHLNSDNVGIQDENGLSSSFSVDLDHFSDTDDAKELSKEKRMDLKDKSMDINQQVMSSLSQAKSDTGPAAEDCVLDNTDVSSSETMPPKEEDLQHRTSKSTSKARLKSRSAPPPPSAHDVAHNVTADSSAGAPLSAPMSQFLGKGFPAAPAESFAHSMRANAVRPRKSKEFGVYDRDASQGRHSYRNSVCSDSSENTQSFLSPRRIMAAISSTDKTIGKFFLSSLSRSSRDSNPVTPSGESLNTPTLSKARQGPFCLQSFNPGKICGNVYTRSESPEHPISLLVQGSPPALMRTPTSSSEQSMTNSPAITAAWPRWRSSRRLRQLERKNEIAQRADEWSFAESLPMPSSKSSRSVVQSFVDWSKSEGDHSPTNKSFEFDSGVFSECSNIRSGDTNRHTGSGMFQELLGDMLLQSSSRSVVAVDIPVCLNDSPKLACDRSNTTTANRPVVFRQILAEPQEMPSATADELGPDSLPRVSISDVIPDTGTKAPQKTPICPDSPTNGKPSSSPFLSSILIPSEQDNLGDSISETCVRKQMHPQLPSQNSALQAQHTPAVANPPICTDVRKAAVVLSKSSYETRARSARYVSKDSSEESTANTTSVTNSTTTTERATTLRALRAKASKTNVQLKSVMREMDRSPPRISLHLWEDTAAAAAIPKVDYASRDERPLTAGRTSLDWEKTLQEAASLNVPPPDFGQILQQCRQCGRTFKPDSLKVHLRGCRTLQHSKFRNSFNGTTLAMRTRSQ